LVEAWNKYYSMSLCPEYWEILDHLARCGVVFCTMEVKREIEKTDDKLAAWIRERPYFFREVDEQVQENLREILKKYGRLTDSARGRSIADPWVIAHAMAEGTVVVTKESPTPEGAKRIKIPDVCTALGVEWMNDFEFLQEAGVTFTAKLGDLRTS